MKNTLLIISIILLWMGCSENDKLTPTTEPEFQYILPQGNHDHDDKIVEWYNNCGFYILYKYESKDVFYNEYQKWQGFVWDSIDMGDDKLHIWNDGYVVELPDEKYVGKQLEWIEEMLFNHYPLEILKKEMHRKIILGKNLALINKPFGVYNSTPVSFSNSIANTLIFSHGDQSIETLTDAEKFAVKRSLHKWLLVERLFDYYPNLDEFFSVTDYSKTLNYDYWEIWKAEGWLISGIANSEEEAKIRDVKTYVEMIVMTPLAVLEEYNFDMNFLFMGYLHPNNDSRGTIRKKYELICEAFLTIGIDLKAIGELYY